MTSPRHTEGARFVYKDGDSFGPRVLDRRHGRWMSVDLVREMAAALPPAITPESAPEALADAGGITGGSGGAGWMPIETAPKDGQMILLCKGRFVVPGWWDAAERMHPWRLVDSTDADEDDTVQLNGWMANSPTLWMPIPPAPNQGAES